MSDRINVLMVDDEEICVQVMEMMLDGTKCDLTSIINGKDAIDYLEKNAANVNVLLLDLVLPDMDGISILKILKNNSKFDHIKIILQSAAMQTPDIIKKYKVKFLRKPYTLKQLTECLDQFAAE